MFSYRTLKISILEIVPIIVTRFAKRSLIHASNFLACVYLATALKFCFLSLCLAIAI